MRNSQNPTTREFVEHSSDDIPTLESEEGNETINSENNHTRTDDLAWPERSLGLSYVSHFTPRALGVGLVIGIPLCFCNVYFGLQTGWGNGMSIPASLMGFAIFRLMSRQLKTPFTPAENVLVQTVAGATGTMPLGSGFTGVMPAIEFLLDKSEGFPVDLGLRRLLIWSLGLSLFGVIFAVPLRREVIVREKLKFPTGTATAVMIGVLHGTTTNKHTIQQAIQEDEANHELLPEHGRNDDPLRTEELVRIDQELVMDATSHSRASMQLLSRSFGVSGLYTIITYFVPQIRDLTIFGTRAAIDWLWTLNPSPAYIGQGIIMGPATTFPMLFGATIGWGILSPLAKRKGWAPGLTSDWETGSRGWIAWIALVIMLTDALVNLCWFLIRSILRFSPRLKPRLMPKSSHWFPSNIFMPFRMDRQAYAPISRRTSSHSAPSSPPAYWASENRQEDAPPEHLVSDAAVLVMFFLSLVACVVSMQVSFGSIIAPQLSVLAVFIAVLLSIMGVRAVGETDINPASGISKFTQLLFALFTSRDNPHRVLINLLAGQVADSGAGQAGDMMQDLKTGHLLKASPKAQFFGAIIGSVFGALISPFIYRMYTSVYELPSPLFPIPQAYVWIFAARLVTGSGLPKMVGTFAVCAAILFTASTILRISLGNHQSASVRKWQPFVPSGIAVAIGMYNPPSFTLARAIGGLFSLWWIQYRKMDETTITVLASGLVLGEGVVSIVSLVLASLDVPHL